MTASRNRRSASPGLRRIFCLLLLAAAGITVAGAFSSSRANNEGRVGALRRPDAAAQPPYHSRTSKIAPWVIAHTRNGQEAEFFVVLADQANLSGAAALAPTGEKGHFVYDALWNKAQATQGPILQWLRERGIEHRSFYIVNAILVKGTRQVAEALAARTDVARV